MKSFFSLILSLISFLSINLYSQPDTLFFNDNLAIYNEHFLSIKSDTSTLFNTHFNDPEFSVIDIDNDDLDELIIIEKSYRNNINTYTIFILTDIDTLKIIDSIYSGTYKPVVDYLDEVNSSIIITGNFDFDDLNFEASNSFTILPINCWKYSDQELDLINDDIYEIFLTENDKILKSINNKFSSENIDCDFAIKYKSAIASIYINYINANENMLAQSFLKKYYKCSDLNIFKSYLDKNL